MQTYEAIRILRKMRNGIPEDELHSIIDSAKGRGGAGRSNRSIKGKGWLSSTLPGYITLAKTRKPTVKKLLKMRKQALKWPRTWRFI